MGVIRAYHRSFAAALLGLVAIFLLIPLLIQISVAREIFTDLDEVPSQPVAIVLGASVYRGEPSPVLAARAHTAAELYLDGKVQKILVSGDDSPYHDEVTPVQKYLIASGVPQGAILLDHAGYDTYLSMYRARRVYGVTAAIVVTQDFHMPRALYLARGVGINAVGLEAAVGESPAFSYAREIPATWKAILDLALSR